MLASLRRMAEELACRAGLSTSLRPREPSLAVLGYHRIGNPGSTRYDPAIFTATAEQLDEHLGFLKRHVAIVGLEEALAVAHGARRSRRLSLLITFDDGYRDNFDVAFPILRSHGIPAVFFLVSSFIES